MLSALHARRMELQGALGGDAEAAAGSSSSSGGAAGGSGPSSSSSSKEARHRWRDLDETFAAELHARTIAHALGYYTAMFQGA